MVKNNKKKNIIITAGPVWVPLDKVRVLTTVFSGNLGIEIALQALRKNYNVILLYGPGRAKLPSGRKNLKIIKYKYFDDLLKLVTSLLKRKDISIFIHSAAVADYRPKKINQSKIKSGFKEFNIKLIPTIKIVDKIKKINPNLYLVKFKLEVNKSKNKLISIARESMFKSNADLIVANDFNTLKKGHKAYIIRNNGKVHDALGKTRIAKKLLNIIESEIIE